MTRSFLVLLWGVVLLAACDSFGEPERFYDETARPPTLAPLDIGDIEPGQHVAGVVAFSLDLDSLGTRLDRFEVRLDGELVGSGNALINEIDTRRYAQGEHTLTVDIWLTPSSLGLLTLLDAPSRLLSVPLIFDQTPPTAVALTSVTFEGTRPRVTWTRNADANFHAYLVVREPLFNATLPDLSTVAVDTVYDQSQTSFVADALPDVIGTEVSYEVRVWNRDREASLGPVRALYGPRSIDLMFPGWSALTHPDGDRLYYLDYDGLIEASAGTLERQRFLEIPWLSLTLGLGHLSIDPQAERLYVSRGPVVAVDLGTFEEIGPLDVSFEADRFIAAGDRLYAVDDLGTLHGLDPDTGASQTTLPDAFSAGLSDVVGRSPDGRSLYVLDAALFAEASALVRVDVSDGTPRLAERAALTGLGIDGVSTTYGATVAPDGRVVTLLSQTVSVFDGRTLRPLASFTSADADPEVSTTAVVVRGGRVYAAFIGGPGPFLDGGEVVELSLDTLQPLRRWSLRHPPSALAFDADGDLLVFTSSDRAWALPL